MSLLVSSKGSPPRPPMAGELSLTGKGVNQTSLTTEPRHFEENWLNVKYKPEGYIPDDDDVDNVDDDVDDDVDTLLCSDG